MKYNMITIAFIAALLLTSCNNTSNQENNDHATIENTTDDLVTTSTSDDEGNTLDITFNNTKGTATVIFNGATIELTEEKPASGFWYTNDQYELSGKGNNVELKKDGEVIFEHQDDIVISTLENKAGQTLHMTFNNTTGEVTVYLDEGDPIELVAKQAASGIWYTNDQYELRGKGENIQLKQDGEVIFEN